MKGTDLGKWKYVLGIIVVSAGVTGFLIQQQNPKVSVPDLQMEYSYNSTSDMLEIRYVGGGSFSSSDFHTLFVSKIQNKSNISPNLTITSENGKSSQGLWVAKKNGASNFPLNPNSTILVHDIQGNESMFVGISKITNEGNEVSSRVITIDSPEPPSS